MQDKSKTKADKKLIQKIFEIDPLDWARYPDGSLSFIAPSGQKFSFTGDNLDQKLLDLKNSASPPKPPAGKADPIADEKTKTKTETRTAGAAAK